MMETSLTTTSEALYQVMDALTIKYRGGWSRLVHISADYAIDSGTTTRVKGKIYRAIVRNRGLDSEQTTGEKVHL